MPRKGFVSRRTVPNDSVFGSDLVQKFINSMMWQGRRSKAQKIFYSAMELIAQKTNDDPMKVFKKAVENVKPLVEVKSRRVGGANYQVPVEVRPLRRTALAMRWVTESARKRGEKSMGFRLAGELMDAAENRGGAIKKREEVHRMAEANKAFAHYRF